MPSTLQNLGLQAALEQRADELHERIGVAVELDLQALELESSIRQALFAVAQGALSNVERHAGASRVSLRLTSENGTVMLAVADNGRGFVDGGGSNSGRGLKLLRHRIESLGGTFTVFSAPDDGTRIEVRLPERHAHAAPAAPMEDPRA
jgi:signal transduction histidine kinase